MMISSGFLSKQCVVSLSSCCPDMERDDFQNSVTITFRKMW